MANRCQLHCRPHLLGLEKPGIVASHRLQSSSTVPAVHSRANTPLLLSEQLPRGSPTSVPISLSSQRPSVRHFIWLGAQERWIEPTLSCVTPSLRILNELPLVSGV